MRTSLIEASEKYVPKRLRLVVLLCDTPIPPVLKSRGTYHDVFTTLFRRSLDLARRDGTDAELTIESYDVVNEEYPASLESADGLLMTGSAASAYDSLPWIDRLVAYIASLPEQYPALPIIGICFGQQIAARAFGGQCVHNPAGWELGVRDCQLTDVGRAILGSERMVHRDHVPSVPPGFHLLGSTTDCHVQGFARFRSGAEPSNTSGSALKVDLRDLNVFAVQGHPEFEPEVVTEIINFRENAGIIDADLAARSRKYAAEHDDGIVIGAIVLKIIGLGS